MEFDNFNGGNKGFHSRKSVNIWLPYIKYFKIKTVLVQEKLNFRASSVEMNVKLKERRFLILLEQKHVLP